MEPLYLSFIAFLPGVGFPIIKTAGNTSESGVLRDTINLICEELSLPLPEDADDEDPETLRSCLSSLLVSQEYCQILVEILAVETSEDTVQIDSVL